MILLMHPSFRNGKAWWYNNRETSPLAGRQSAMNDHQSKEFDRITDLGKARSDEYTERLLAFVQDMEASGPEPFIPLLADIALVRALIVHLVILYGVKRTYRRSGCVQYDVCPDETNSRDYGER